jgi:hypothetical protein
MFRKAKSYVVIQENVPLTEARAIEHAVVTVLPPVQPSQNFVQQLGADLLEEARHQHTTGRHPSQALRIFGIVGGGLLPVIGGLVLWMLTRHPKDKGESSISPQQRRMTATAGTA